MDDINFRVPIQFQNSFLGTVDNNKSSAQRILDATFLHSRPVAIEHWSRAEESIYDYDCGIIVGCSEGSLFVFNRPSIAPATPTEVADLTIPKPPRRKSRASYNNNNSSAGSPASLVLSPSLHSIARPRVVSGITTEPVEAPKNYVDFDDEPDKLKDILKGITPRDRSSVADSSSGDKAQKSNSPSIMEVPKPPNPVPRSLLSASNSRATSPCPFAAPGSEGHHLSATWTLKYHIIPSSSGAVKSIHLLPDQRHFVVLRESGGIHVYSTNDGSCKASFHPDLDHPENKRQAFDFWIWHRLTVARLREAIILVARAAGGGEAPFMGDSPEIPSEASKCLVVELTSTPLGLHLKKIGQFELDGPAPADAIHVKSDGSLIYLYASYNGHLVAREIHVPSVREIVSVNNGEPDGKHITYGQHLSIPLAFKSIISRSTDHIPSTEKIKTHEAAAPLLAEPRDVGTLIEGLAPCGMNARTLESGRLWGIVWFHKEIAIFEYADDRLENMTRFPVHDVQDAIWIDDGLIVLRFEDRLDLCRLRLDDNGAVENIEPDTLGRIQFRTLSISRLQTFSVMHNSLLVVRQTSIKQQPEIVTYPLSRKDMFFDVPETVWQSESLDIDPSLVILSSMLSLDSETFIFGCSDGYLREYSLTELGRKGNNLPLISASSKTSASSLHAHVCGLHIVQNLRTREKYVVGGGDDGSIAFWSLNTFDLAARWIIFTSPLSHVIQVEAEKAVPLRGCALCISRDGTVAVVGIDGFHLLYLVPGSTGPVTKICLEGQNLLLLYADHHARLWDSKTKELWRSMGQDKADDLLAQGKWVNLVLPRDVRLPKTIWRSIANSYDGFDAAASLSLNLEQLIIDSVSVTKTISTNEDEVRAIFMALARLKLILSLFLTPGLNTDIDSICYKTLGACQSSLTPGSASIDTTTLYGYQRPDEVWCMSEMSTATRVLAIVSVLRAMSLFEELTEAASTVISFYTTALGQYVGPKFKAPSLEFLGRCLFEGSNELRPAIRNVFDCTISNMSDQAAIEIAEHWQHHVPILQPDADKESLTAALALLICGCVAAERYSLLSVNVLMDISKSTSLYLHDEKSTYHVLAIDLCSRGFHVWQHYVDAQEMLRCLFNIATSSRKDAISLQNMGSQARLSVLSIATNHMPLLMNTLCLDILSPPTMEHRRSVLQVVAFLIKKRPLILQPHLPRLMEAVVKSLDPNSTSDREMVLDAATEIISFVVKTYSTVCFHMASQRLAVGTNEGAVVMYDLKTAIRLYVLEGHKKAIAACSFSPDGRRLVTLCLRESSVLVWKVGSSFSSFFNPGVPPRQGHGGSAPFKTLNFNIGADAEMTTEESLDLVRVEWVTDRSAQVKIRQSVLTIGT